MTQSIQEYLCNQGFKIKGEEFVRADLRIPFADLIGRDLAYFQEKYPENESSLVRILKLAEQTQKEENETKDFFENVAKMITQIGVKPPGISPIESICHRYKNIAAVKYYRWMKQGRIFGEENDELILGLIDSTMTSLYRTSLGMEDPADFMGLHLDRFVADILLENSPNLHFENFCRLKLDLP